MSDRRVRRCTGSRRASASLPEDTSHYLLPRASPRRRAIASSRSIPTRAPRRTPTIVEASRRAARACSIGASAPAARRRGERTLVLVYALAKGDKVDAVVRDATELGATRIVIARTERAVVQARRRGARRPRSSIAGRASPSRPRGSAGAPIRRRSTGVSRGPTRSIARPACDARFCLDPARTGGARSAARRGARAGRVDRVRDRPRGRPHRGRDRGRDRAAGSCLRRSAPSSSAPRRSPRRSSARSACSRADRSARPVVTIS